jgi:hypothetical protein
MALQNGEVFAGYTILRMLGSGGMGQVYLATHPRLPRQDALKVLPADFTVDPEYRGRFEREAELAATLSHPHIVGIHDRGEFDGQFWISMDYVAGTDVGKLLLDEFPNGLPVDEAISILAAVASALDYAHRRGLLHRDVKPSNILLSDPDGQARRAFLADFGIARRIDDSAGLTATDMAVGTVAYAAPEQLKAEPVDGRADQYALACTAFHMLSGAPPYVHSNPAVVITQHVTAPPPSIGARRSEVAGLDGVFARAMAKNPARRFDSCGEFVAVLAQQLSGGAPAFVYQSEPSSPVASGSLPPPRRKRRRTGLLIGALVVAAAVIAGGVLAVLELTGPGRPVPAPGPFGGTYRADFGQIVGLGSPPGVPVPAVSDSYGLRSTCRASGCVMTASRLTGAAVGEGTLVFDQIGDRWVAVSLRTDRCQNTSVEFWDVFTVQPRADGSLSGAYTEASPLGCADQRNVILTRTGDLTVGGVADPAGQQPRRASPAEGLRGRYSVIRTFTGVRTISPLQASAAVATACVRTGDRCMSFFYGATGDMPLVFGAGTWIWDASGQGRCQTGDTTAVRDFGEYALPQPAPNPITSLSGHGHHTQGDPCPIDTDFDQKFTRISD